jgi:hypothetical protein
MDVIAPATTICRPGDPLICDLDESCTGVADATCPPDTGPEPGCECDPRTQGYWHRQCLGVPASEGGIDPGRDGRGPTFPNEPNFWDPDLGFLDTYNCADAVLATDIVFGLTDVCEGLDADPPSDMCEKAEKQLTALILNVCSERVSEEFCVTDLAAIGCESTNVGDLIQELADLINMGDCQLANDCADAVNTGDAIGFGGDGASNSAPESSTTDDEGIRERTPARQPQPADRSRRGGRT